ncbi:hypothetical protein L1987_40456 [Smallanthus sonchifolius]|uniref:Uncharacterized protein n=1 Tax=Smallanthus sonchifolius TaxID=185202 RepID=A0ACB9GU75_9ASTR|nr:hypothetical protein L1987_40456 [Smallanthus sonchifolius]
MSDKPRPSLTTPKETCRKELAYSGRRRSSLLRSSVYDQLRLSHLSRVKWRPLIQNVIDISPIHTIGSKFQSQFWHNWHST